MSGQQKDQRPQVAKNHSVPHSSTTSKHQAYRTLIRRLFIVCVDEGREGSSLKTYSRPEFKSCVYPGIVTKGQRIRCQEHTL